MQELTGRTAVVTGAASGIGRALARRFGAEGMNVVLADIEDAPLAEATESLAADGVEVLAVPTDVRDADALDHLARVSIERFGTVHLLCNNAGVGGGGPMHELAIADWKWVLDVNLNGVVNGIHAFLPHLYAHGEAAHVVNTASMAGWFGWPGMGPYCASKFAVVGLSECLFHETRGTNVGVSVLCPGWVDTNIADSGRNRPGAPQGAITGSTEGAELVRQLISNGLAPAVVADAVVDAIRSDRFWVLTHPDMAAGARGRLEGALAGRNPGELAG